MIFYTRTEWYGLHYLVQLSGSVVPRCIPAMIVGGSISFIFSVGWVDKAGFPIRDYFGHPYAMQLLGLVFGYLSIARLNVSLTRYWEGVTQLKTMHSKWADACSQAVTYDRLTNSGVQLTNDGFCLHIVRLFQQLSVVAIMNLHTNDWEQFRVDEKAMESEEQQPLKKRKRGLRFRKKKKDQGGQ